MEQIAFYDAKPYDKIWFDALAPAAGISIRYLENRLDKETALLAHGCRAACMFVSDTADEPALRALSALGVEALALRCAGYNNVDISAAERNHIAVYRVPAYSPSSVAQHALALLLTLARRTHKAFTRTRERNFSLEGLTGIDLEGMTVGVIGTGKVGLKFCQMCMGIGMKVIAYDINPIWGMGIEYVRMDELLRRSDVISLHCPLTPQTYHMISRSAFHAVKDGVYIINTSRGALIDSQALLDNIKSGKVGAAGLDVYEEETDYFYEDVSSKVMSDDTLNLLLSQPNVLVTGHQAFLTDQALRAIAETTVDNLRCFFEGVKSPNRLRPAASAAAL